MERPLFALVTIFIFLMSMLASAIYVKSVKANIITVPDDYPTVHEAVDQANEGDTVFVRAGFYQYPKTILFINKSITLAGDESARTMLSLDVRVFADNVVIKNLELWSGCPYLRLYYCSNCLVANVSLVSVRGVELVDAYNNTMVRTHSGSGDLILINSWGNTVSDSCFLGKSVLTDSHENLICNSTFSEDVTFTNSHRNIIYNNTIVEFGVYLQNANDNLFYGNVFISYLGMFISSTCSEVIQANLFNGSSIGILGEYCNLTITENVFVNCLTAIELSGADGLAYHNSFHGHNGVALTGQSTVGWDDGYPSGGNYWSDYRGMDLFSGPYQNETGSDCIGDTPYTIIGDDRDKYPLMIPWGSLLGDVNGDGYVGIDDINLVASHFGSEAGRIGYLRVYDLNGDRFIGIDDLFTVASLFGKENP